MYCKYCGKEIADGSTFCKYCGKQLKNVQVNCNSQSQDNNGDTANLNKQNFAEEHTETREEKTEKRIVPIIITTIIVVIIVVLCFLNNSNNIIRNTNIDINKQSINCKELSDKIEDYGFDKNTDVSYLEREKDISAYYDNECKIQDGFFTNTHDKGSMLALNARNWAENAKKKGNIDIYIAQLKNVITYKQKSNMDDKDAVIKLAYIDMGKAYYTQKKYTEAIKAYEKAYPYYEKDGNLPVFLPEYIADAYFALNEDEKAYNKYLETIENIKNEKSNSNESYIKTFNKEEAEISKKISKIEERINSNAKNEIITDDAVVEKSSEKNIQDNTSVNEENDNAKNKSNKSINWEPYMKDLEQRIKGNWTPPRGDNSKRIVVKFTIDKKGNLLNKSVIKSSGNEDMDKAALDAIDNTSFKPLPSKFKGESVPIEFTFDYNVLNSATGKN